MSTPICDLAPSYWLLFGENVPPLIYYTQIPNLLISLLLAVVVLLLNRRALSNQILFITLFSFCTWIFFNQMFWATNRGDVIMFSWLMDILVEPLVHIGIFYLLYTLITQKDASFKAKLFFGLLYLPIPILLPSALTLSALDIQSCLATEGPIALFYTYLVEIVATLSLFVFLVTHYIKSTEKNKRKEILYLGLGGLLLLFAFSWGNITGSITDDWELGQYGLFGMPIFIAFLVYSIVKFGTLHMKVLATQALVVSSLCMLFALLFIHDIATARWVIGVNFLVFAVLGYQIIRSVQREIAQREKIELLAHDLDTANHKQENLLHFITHEVKGYLTKNKAVFASVVEGDFKDVPPTLLDLAKRALEDTDKGVATVRDLLDSSNLKKGTTEYKKEPFDFKALVEDSVLGFKQQATERRLSLTLEVTPGTYQCVADHEKLQRHVIRNLIDNALRYTKEGEIHVSLSSSGKTIHFKVQDTGVGISEEDKRYLFTEGGHGKDSIKINVESSGYGLFIAKVVVEAHKGKIWVESWGPGKGATFFVDIPCA